MGSKIAMLKMLNAMSKNTLMETLDIRYTDLGDDFIVATMPVTPKVHQPDGILNGGATLALAESVGSPTSLLFTDPKKFVVRGIQMSANHLKSVKEGLLTARARFVHKGRTTHLLEIEIKDDKNNLISVCRLTNIILPRN
jgi:uncharacterized protein (TIGR00369 family)